jgi:hypothetical protein
MPRPLRIADHRYPIAAAPSTASPADLAYHGARPRVSIAFNAPVANFRPAR